MTPQHFECKKVTERNMIATQNWYHINQQSLGMKYI